MYSVTGPRNVEYQKPGCSTEIHKDTVLTILWVYYYDLSTSDAYKQ
jgi:hypothetical protein